MHLPQQLFLKTATSALWRVGLVVALAMTGACDQEPQPTLQLQPAPRVPDATPLVRSSLAMQREWAIDLPGGVAMTMVRFRDEIALGGQTGDERSGKIWRIDLADGLVLQELPLENVASVQAMASGASPEGETLYLAGQSSTHRAWAARYSGDLGPVWTHTYDDETTFARSIAVASDGAVWVTGNGAGGSDDRSDSASSHSGASWTSRHIEGTLKVFEHDPELGLATQVHTDGSGGAIVQDHLLTFPVPVPAPVRFIHLTPSGDSDWDILSDDTMGSLAGFTIANERLFRVGTRAMQLSIIGHNPGGEIEAVGSIAVPSNDFDPGPIVPGHDGGTWVSAVIFDADYAPDSIMLAAVDHDITAARRMDLTMSELLGKDHAPVAWVHIAAINDLGRDGLCMLVEWSAPQIEGRQSTLVKLSTTQSRRAGLELR